MSAPKEAFVFPIAALQGGWKVASAGDQARATVRSNVVNYCAWKLGFDELGGTRERESLYAIASEYAESLGLTDEYDPESGEYVLLVGCKFLNISLYSIDSQKRYSAYRKLEDSTTGKCRVAFPRLLFWDALEKWPYRDFAVLCAVWAAIGNDTFKKVQYERIAALACGYSSAKEMPKTESHRLLTRDQVRWTVGQLESQGWFVRCPANRRHMYYSKRLTVEQLEVALAKWEAKRAKSSMSERANNVAELAERLRKLSAQHPHYPSQVSPQHSRTIPTTLRKSPH